MINEIFVGLVVTILGTILIYFYKKRQLYAVIPKMYEFSYFSDNGTVCELKFFNKGINIEEEILLEINADKKLELLSASTSSIILSENKIKIPRLFSDTEASMILSIDDGRLSSKDLISITSKNIKGKIYNDVLEVPPSSRSVIYWLLAISLLVSIFYFNLPDKIINYFNSSKTELINTTSKVNTELISKGWSSLNRYYSSELSDSYSDEEFPIRFVSMKQNGKLIKVTYEIINKSALPINVTVQDTMVDYKKTSENKKWHNYREEKVIKPLSKDKIEIESLRSTSESIAFEFHIKFGTDFIYNLLHTISIEPFKKLTDEYKKSTIVGKWESNYGSTMYLIENYKKDGKYEMYLWRDKFKNSLYQHTTGMWDVRNGFIYINNMSRGRKVLTFKSPDEIYNITNKEIIVHSVDRGNKVTKKKLPDNFRIFPHLTDKQITEKIVGMWEENPKKLIYKVYNYKKDGNVIMDMYLNKAKTVKLLSSKAKWEIKNRLLTYIIIDTDSEHNMSIGADKGSKIIDINDQNFSYYNDQGRKSFKYKLMKE